jgi:hypothetical protein
MRNAIRQQRQRQKSRCPKKGGRKCEVNQLSAEDSRPSSPTPQKSEKSAKQPPPFGVARLVVARLTERTKAAECARLS